MALFTGCNIGEDRRMEEGRRTGGDVQLLGGGGPSNARLGPSAPNYTITPFQMALSHFCKSFINNIMK